MSRAVDAVVESAVGAAHSEGAAAGRTRMNAYFENPLAGIDQLLHGSNNLRGWGSTSLPDATLLIARGFDASSKTFKYDVNPRFGDTRGSHTLSRTPFRITFDFTIDLSTNYDVQQLRRALEPVKSKSGWTRRGADSLTAFYASRTSDIYKLILSESDSLFITPAQTAQLKQADSAFTLRLREIFVPLGDYLAKEPEGSAGKAALDTVAAVQKSYWKSFWSQPEIANEILTPLQRELLPMMKNLVAVPQKDRSFRSGTLGIRWSSDELGRLGRGGDQGGLRADWGPSGLAGWGQSQRASWRLGSESLGESLRCE